MGIFGKISGTDKRYSKYKHRAEVMLKLVFEHANNLERDFYNIMSIEANKAATSLKLTGFLAGAVAEFEENKGFFDIRGWKIMTLDKAIGDVMKENGFSSVDLHYYFHSHSKEKFKDNEPLLIAFLKHFSCHQGGRSVSIRLKDNDDINALLNLTIFLDTLEASDRCYENYMPPRFKSRFSNIKLDSL